MGRKVSDATNSAFARIERALGGASTGTSTTVSTVQPTAPTNPPTISKAEFDAIQAGMTYEQVVAIVGGPGELASESTFGSSSSKSYTWKGVPSASSFAGGSAFIQFQNNAVVGRSQNGLT